MILSSLAYITPIRLSFCISATRRSLLDRRGEGGRKGGGEREGEKGRDLLDRRGGGRGRKREGGKEGGRGRKGEEGGRIFVKKKKITKSVRNDFKVKQMIKNDKKNKIYIITILMRNNVRNGSPTIDAVDTFGHIFASKWQLKVSLSCFFYHSLSFT